jgi:ubiquinone/menaquinone biosynthesis C-methylase UbiE
MKVPTQRLIELLDTFTPLSSATAILDIGCGPGNATAQLLNTRSTSINPATTYIASDFSRGMVLQTTKLRDSKLDEASSSPSSPSSSSPSSSSPVISAEEKNLWKRVVPLVLDATALSPLLDNTFSHIIANHVFFLTNNPFKAVQEAYRVLSPNGVMACSSWHRTTWLDYLGLAATRLFSDLDKSPPDRLELPAEWSNVERVSEQLSNAGFKDIRTEYVETAMILPKNLDDWVHVFVTSGNPAVTWITDLLNEEEVKELEVHVVQVLKEKRQVNDQGEVIIPGTAVVAAGRK